MTARDYTTIEGLLESIEELTLERPPQTRPGVEIQAEVRELLRKVTKERIRAEQREGSNPSEEKK